MAFDSPKPHRKSTDLDNEVSGTLNGTKYYLPSSATALRNWPADGCKLRRITGNNLMFSWQLGFVFCCFPSPQAWGSEILRWPSATTLTTTVMCPACVILESLDLQRFLVYSKAGQTPGRTFSSFKGPRLARHDFVPGVSSGPFCPGLPGFIMESSQSDKGSMDRDTARHASAVNKVALARSLEQSLGDRSSRLLAWRCRGGYCTARGWPQIPVPVRVPGQVGADHHVNSN